MRFAQPSAGTKRAEPVRAAIFVVIFVTALFGVSVWAIGRLNPQLAWNEVSFSEPGGAGWFHQTVLPSTSKKSPRRLILYRLTPLSNWKMEFRWNADAAGIGLIVRSSDVQNYSALRLRPSPDGFIEERFRVTSGVEGKHSRKNIVFPDHDRDLLIKIEDSGQEVALSAQHELMDAWSEQEMDSRNAGFFEERNEKTTARAIHISIQNRASPGEVFGAVARAARTWWDSHRSGLF